MTLTYRDGKGPLGTIIRVPGGLHGSTRSLQRMADQALAREHGDQDAAYARLLRGGNAYLRVTESGGLGAQLASEPWEHEQRDSHGRWRSWGDAVAMRSGQFYHGRADDPGEQVSKGAYNFFTPSFYQAATWARRQAQQTGGVPRVYPVKPTGRYGDDPGSYEGFRSASPLHIEESAFSVPSSPQMMQLARTYRAPAVQHGPLYAGKDENYQRDAAAWDELSQSAVELSTGGAWLHELRGPNGEWVHSPTDAVGEGINRYAVPPHERLINPRADHPDPADYPFFKKHPVSADNIVKAYDAATPEMKHDGMHWYSDAHLLAKALAHGNAEEGAILLANYSPQANWPINMFRAARVADEGKPIAAGDGYVTNDQVKKAQKALDGQHIDQVLISPKTRSFAHLLAHGGDSPDDPYGHVAVDAHALNVAAGGDIRGATYGSDEKRKKIPPEDMPPIGTDVRAYEYVADQYREAAQRIARRDGIAISPHQIQAVTWVGQVLANQAADRAVMEQQGSAKGRLSGRAKDWQRWLAYAGQHHMQLQPGISALSNPAGLAAQILEMAFDPAEPRDAHGRWARGGIAGQIEKITEPIGMEGARGNSRPVSHAEFQAMAAEGRDRLRAIQSAPWGTEGMRRNWPVIKERTFAEVQKSWGGATIDPRTGQELPQGADKYAMSIKPSGLDTTSVPETASPRAFSDAMDAALAKYGNQLAKGGSYLGVFHDDDLHRIDIDPVTVLSSLREVETVGAYTHAIGGAYHFASGDGFWPPHVAEGAQMSNDGQHWAGPGQWHSHATAVQQPHDEPEDNSRD